MEILFLIISKFYFVFVAQLLLVMLMGLQKADSGKRFAAMFQSFPFFAIFITGQFITDKEWNQYLIFIPIAASVLFCVLLRKKVFPYNIYCSSCGKTRDWKVILLSDETVCYDCYKVQK